MVSIYFLFTFFGASDYVIYQDLTYCVHLYLKFYKHQFNFTFDTDPYLISL